MIYWFKQVHFTKTMQFDRVAQVANIDFYFIYHFGCGFEGENIFLNSYLIFNGRSKINDLIEFSCRDM